MKLTVLSLSVVFHSSKSSMLECSFLSTMWMVSGTISCFNSTACIFTEHSYQLNICRMLCFVLALWTRLSEGAVQANEVCVHCGSGRLCLSAAVNFLVCQYCSLWGCYILTPAAFSLRFLGGQVDRQKCIIFVLCSINISICIVVIHVLVFFLTIHLYLYITEMFEVTVQWDFSSLSCATEKYPFQPLEDGKKQWFFVACPEKKDVRWVQFVWAIPTPVLERPKSWISWESWESQLQSLLHLQPSIQGSSPPL